MRVVCDTNILISAFIFPGGPPDQVVTLSRLKEFTLCLSPDILTEFKKVLISKFKYSPTDANLLLERVTSFCEMIYPHEKIEIIKRVDADNRILECALEAKADFLISGDKRDILPLRKIEKTLIITASEFLEYWRTH
ncbi:MAG: putative toxin-antitoxin system toxin component, PIN family [Chlamydiae bacterium]|nr:putative toxin-antitoxin system toxin component, PIN family [Chlamydiota bacterium]MBI3266434.1 putative toxin-antitoxin system toxin component, PIN family [Chlamydiota bacterium]